MTKKTKWGLFALIALLITGMALYPTIKNHLKKEDQGPLKGKETGKDKKPPLPVNALIIKQSSLTDNFKSKGLLQPDEEVDLSFETSGKITAIIFEEGTSVHKGQLLAKVNDSPLQAQLKILQTQLPLAQDRVRRQKLLLEKDAVSQETYESVSTDLEKLKADMELIKSQIAQTELRAPFDGVIGLRQVSAGAYATPQTVIAKLTKISPLKIEFSVNEKQASEVKQGTLVSFTLENDNNRYQASVYAVESQLDDQTFSLKVRARYPNPGGKLKPGHSATIDIKLREIKNAIVIPSISSIAEMGRDLVFVYKGGKAHQVEIKKGIRTASDIQVIEGLVAGDTLLTTGVMQLRDDMPVKITDIK